MNLRTVYSLKPATLMAILLLAGCRPAAPVASPEGRHPRIISLAPSVTEIVFALGAATQLVGRSSACDYPPDLVKQVPVVGDFGVPSLERLLAAKPDAVLYT
ncbi:MAG: ABC transporter substrate-binding protein, partial [bacterium]